MKVPWVVAGVAGVVAVAVTATTFAVSRPTDSIGSSGAFRPTPTPPIMTEHGTVEFVLPEEKIVAIDEPSFRETERVRDLTDEEPVLSVEVGDDARAYPLRYLIFHEIVNDVVGGDPLVVTYCPLCNTGIAFRRPRVGGHVLDFGVSGRLLNGNLVMVDRQTSSLWSQALGEAVSGELEGRRLEFVPAQIVGWSQWRRANPVGRVLAEPEVAGLPRGGQVPYGANPYAGYDRTRRPPIDADRLDHRLRPTARLLAVGTGPDPVAVPYRTLRRHAVGGRAAIVTRVGGSPAVVLWQRGTTSVIDAGRVEDSRDVGAAMAYSPVLEGRRVSIEATPRGFVDRETSSRWTIFGRAVSGPLRGSRLEPLVAVDHLWFEWAAFHPDARVIGVR